MGLHNSDEYVDCGCPPQRGHSHARLFTPPLRDLTPETTDGYRAIRFAEALGLGLMPWQKWALIHGLELREDGTFRFKQLVLLVPRQAGKSTLAVLLMLFWSAIQDAKLTVVAAQDLATSEEMWGSVVEFYQEHPMLAGQMLHEPVRAAGKMALVLTGGRRIMPKASNARSGRGLSIDRLFMDELREQKKGADRTGWEAWDALSSATIARPNSQILGASNAGTIESVLLAYLRESALADIKEGSDSGTGLLEWSAHEDADPGDTEVWRVAHPGYGYTITPADLRAKYTSMPIGSWRTEFLCQWVTRLDEPISLAAWEDSADPRGDLRHAFKARQIHAGMQVSADGHHVTLIGAAVDKTNPERHRVRLQVLRTWAGETAVTEAETELKGIVDKLRPRTLSWFPTGPGAVLSVVMSKIKSTKIVPLQGPSIAGACASFAEQVSARSVLHSGEPVLTSQVTTAARHYVGKGWEFDIRDLSVHADALYAASAAVQQARLTPDITDRKIISVDPEEGN